MDVMILSSSLQQGNPYRRRIGTKFSKTWMCATFSVKHANTFLCALSAQSKVEVDFPLTLLRYFIPDKGSIIYFSAQTTVGVSYWKSICTFLGRHLIWNGGATVFSSFLVVNEQQWQSVSEALLSLRQGPLGPTELVLRFHSISVLWTIPSTLFFPFF